MRWPIVASLVISACGGLLPFGEDDAETPPSVEPDASDDARAADAGAAGDGESTAVDAEADADAAAWRCFTGPMTGMVYLSSQDCEQARLGEVCNTVTSPPSGEACPRGASDETYCQPCNKTGDGGAYGYAKTVCRCL